MTEKKYITIAEVLERRVKNGTYRDRLPGVFRLAEEFSTSHVTASQAVKYLAARGYVTVVGTRGALVTPNLPVKARSRIICVVGGAGAMLRNVYNNQMIADEAEKHGYRTIDLTMRNAEVIADPVFLEAFHVDGFIFMFNALSPQILSALREFGFPLVSINRWSDETGVSWVDHANCVGISIAFEHFYEHGHRRIVQLGECNRVDFHQRALLDAYTEFMTARGIFDSQLFASDCVMREFLGVSPL